MIANTDYYWEGVFQSGEKTKGLINANSIPLAKAALRKQGIITRKIVKKRNPFYSQYTRGIKPSDITLFTRQLATLIAAGIPADRVQTVSFGKEMPADSGSGESAWTKNRRAEFGVVK